MSAATALLEVDHVVKTYADRRSVVGARGRGRTLTAVADVSFTLDHGETLAVVGESGCGKSTLAKLLARLESPTTGSITVDGRRFDQLGRADRTHLARNVQMVFQDPYSSLDPRFTVEATVTEPWIVHPHVAPPKARFRDEAAALLASVGLPANLLDRRPAQLSGGQLQRAAIARALALGPQLLLCDEPVSALDVSAQAKVLNVLAEVQRERGISSVFISHDLAVVRHVAHRVAVMYLGRIVELASRDQLFAAPRHPYTTALLSAEPKPRTGGVERTRIVLRGELPDPADPPSGCTFRTRCWKAAEVCAEVVPPLLDEGGSLVACHFPEPAPAVPAAPTAAPTAVPEPTRRTG